MRQRKVTGRGRQRAFDIATSMNLVLTGRVISDGQAPPHVVRIIATDEHADLHRNCPCCHGLSSIALEKADFLVESMFEEF